MEKIHQDINDLEKEINLDIDDGDKYLLQMDLVENYKKLVDLIFTDYLFLKNEQDKKKNYTKNYYSKNKDKIKSVSLKHYYNNKE
tara:strand:- start:255 stop:509 length:255 start_codon:yes stop_codon:yes gene_type:complete